MGTLEWKSLQMTKERYAEMLVTKLIPAIMVKWPRKYDHHGCLFHQVITLQHNNAKAHVSQEEFVEYTKNYYFPGSTFKTLFQPSNLPDLNILDLAFFCSLEREYQKKKSSSLDDLHKHLLVTYWDYSCVKIQSAFMTLKALMNQIIDYNG